jgi:aminopeptidase N
MNNKRIIFCLIFSFFINNIILASNINNKLFIGDSIDVLHYNIHLKVVHLSQKNIQGYTDLTITPKTDSISDIPLYLLALTIDSILVNDTIVLSFNYNDTILHIPLLNVINTGDTICVKVFYHGHPKTASSGYGGFYFSGDSAFAYSIGIGIGEVPPNYGRVWFPCVDDFIDRATYDFYITTDDDKMAVCGGTLISENDNGDSTVTYHWNLSNTIPSYLTSVAVGNYVGVKDTFNGINGQIPVVIYVKPSDTAKVGGTFANLKDILTIYEDHWGPYSWERVGYVGVPFSSGAMEHATNIAYPNACIDGSSTYEWLYAHELSHHWFGDLITCASASEMWINEGWAVFNESLFREGLYGKEAYKTNMRKRHKEVLQFTHIYDNAYIAISGVPPEYTYGSTVYDKGACVVHTLRGYMGDSIFFNTVKAYLNHFAYNHVSTIELRDFFSSWSGIDLNDFFDFWVLSPGFPHFSVDSFFVSQNGQNYDVNVFIRQKLKESTTFANSNKTEITFMDSTWQQFTDTIIFSGEYGNKTFNVPFMPEIVMVDFDEKICDATTDFYKVIKTTGETDFTTTYFKLNVLQITDSAFVRATHNWVVPDPLKNPNPDIFRLSDYRYWKIDGIFPNNFEAQGKFYYNRTNSISSGYLDNTFLPTDDSADSLILLYRKDASVDWQMISFIKSGTHNVGYLMTDNLKKGEYTLAIGEPNQSYIESNNIEVNTLKVYPNPSNNTFTIEFNILKKSTIKIYNSAKILVKSIDISPKQSFVNWQPVNLSKGIYYIQIYSSDNKITARKKVIYM